MILNNIRRNLYIIMIICCTIITSSLMLNDTNVQDMNCTAVIGSTKGLKKADTVKESVKNAEPKDKEISVNSTSISSGAFSFYYPYMGTITSAFGRRWGRMHYGIDIAAKQGAPVSASAGGTISYAGWENGYGYIVKIDHGYGVETYYGHCSKILVKKGQRVKKGDVIAKAGSTGNSTGPHIHFEIRINGVAKNPVNYLKK